MLEILPSKMPALENDDGTDGVSYSSLVHLSGLSLIHLVNEGGSMHT